jgi:antitoxin MazE
MKVQLIHIGNSRGIRIPKPIIEQCGLGDMVDLQTEHNRLVITPHRAPREGWEEAFAAAGGPSGDDLRLDFPNEFDEKEWHW